MSRHSALSMGNEATEESRLLTELLIIPIFCIWSREDIYKHYMIMYNQAIHKNKVIAVSRVQMFYCI